MAGGTRQVRGSKPEAKPLLASQAGSEAQVQDIQLDAVLTVLRCAKQASRTLAMVCPCRETVALAHMTGPEHFAHALEQAGASFI